eukprot:gene1149-4368_t
MVSKSASVSFVAWISTGFCALLMGHAAYSASKYHSYLKVNHEDFARLPVDIIMQIIIAVVLGVIGIVSLNANFMDIHLTTQLKDKTWESACPQPSFRVFHNTRCSVINSAND